MRTSSNRELARQIGVSETAVRRAEKAGRIRREPDGAWDLARVKALWARNTDSAQQRRQHGAMKPVPEAALGAVRETLREHGEPVSAGGMTFMQARTANEVLKAQERRVRLQRMKGELVDRAKAVAQVFRLARDERDAWVNWPARVELAKRNSKQRIDPLIEESEVLRERVKERRSRDSGNTVLSKEFPGGVLILTGANSAVGLRSMPARYLFLDEVDGYPGDVQGEGDPSRDCSSPTSRATCGRRTTRACVRATAPRRTRTPAMRSASTAGAGASRPRRTSTATSRSSRAWPHPGPPPWCGAGTPIRSASCVHGTRCLRSLAVRHPQHPPRPAPAWSPS
jgi:Phage terminase large subunit (GpA)